MELGYERLRRVVGRGGREGGGGFWKDGDCEGCGRVWLRRVWPGVVVVSGRGDSGIG